MGRSLRLSDLAIEAGIEVDEALVILWDKGLSSLTSPSDIVPARELTKARHALGLPTTRDIVRYSYWRDRLEMPDKDFQQLLGALHINYSASAKNLPKGAVRKLRNYVETMRVPAPRKALEVREAEVSAPQPLQWTTIGRPRPVIGLSAETLQRIHEALRVGFADTEDPIEPPGVRLDLLESSAMRPSTSLAGTAKYGSVEMAAGALLHSIVHNHPFHNGNKRTALVAMLVTLDENGSILTCHEDELFKFVVRVAQHGIVPKHLDQLADREVLEIAKWIRANTRRIDRTERLIKWHKLRQILTSYECRLSHPSVGNRINIERDVPVVRERVLQLPAKSLRFGPPRTELKTLKTQVAYRDEGEEVDRSTIKKIRRDLELDDEHGVDSEIFYRGASTPDDFIAAYRKTLRRLAKL